MVESQSVSAQLYYKQLPNQPGNPDSDATIENAFQKQLDLSEYYKSKPVFEAMKKDYMDKTMEGSVAPDEPVPISRPIKTELIPTPNNIPVGPRDFINKGIKSTFGATKSGFSITPMNIAMVILVCLVAYWLYFLAKRIIKK